LDLENETADAVVKHLTTSGIAHLAEWDVLAFVYQHGASLASAEKIASLLGYTKDIVGSSLESLTAKGLLKRSRNSRGVRLYQFVLAGPNDPLQLALEELMKIAGERRGRLILISHLRQAVTKDRRERPGLHLA
jgi:DNA-binding transcriptional ArsR family regulator